MAATVADGLAIVGTIFAVGLFSSQIPMVRRIAQQGSAKGFSCLPTYLLLATVASWLGYSACVLRRIDLVVLNAIGFIFQCVYLVVFSRYSDYAARRQILLVFCGINIFVAAQYVILFAIFPSETGAWSSEFTASCAVIITISMFISPARALYGAYLELDESRVPEFLSLASLLYSSVWAAFGALIGDYFIVTPNACGVALSVAQLATLMYVKCRKRGRSSNIQPQTSALGDMRVAEIDVSELAETGVTVAADDRRC
jgi:hypothetical protein